MAASDRPTRAERLRREAPHRDSASTPYSVLLGIFAFLLVFAVSVRQVTSEEVGRRLIENGLASLTDIDRVVTENREPLAKAAASNPDQLHTVPGYSVEAFLSSDEIRASSDPELARLILHRASGIIYVQGADAFNVNGKQSISLFSREGVLRWFVGRVSDANHTRASVAAVVLTGLTALAALGVVLKNDGFTRLRTLGIVVLVAALAGDILVTGLATLIVDQLWGGDPFSGDVNRVLKDGVSVFQLNYLVLTCLGLFLAVAGIVGGLIAGRTGDDQSEVLSP